MRNAWAAGAFFAFVFGWTACVGDDPVTSSSSGAVGEAGGACFADGKCKEGLFCRLPERVCLTREDALADGGTIADPDGGNGVEDASLDGGGNDAASDGGDAGSGGCHIVPFPMGLYCASDDTACMSVCCIAPDGTAACVPSYQNCGNGAVFACDDAKDCTGAACCADVTTTPTPTLGCSTARGVTGSACSSVGCGTSQVELCTGGPNDCPGAKCVPVEMVVNGKTIVRGVCQ